MMLDYYGLHEQPFGVAPDPRYLYLSPTHSEALASLAYGIEAGRGFMALIAPPGMGKTTLLFHVLERLGESTRTVFLFRNPADPQDLLEALMADLEVEAQGKSPAWMCERLNEILIEENRKGRRFVLVIDEAQNLSETVLETVRQWSNFETSSSKLMQIILAGQPALADRLMSPSLIQLRQRISIIAQLQPLNAKEVAEYIQHRLRVAGYEGRSLLTQRALDRVVEESKGIPRNINNLCFNALSLGYALQRKKIDVDLVTEAASDLDMLPLTSERQEGDLDSILLEGQSVEALRPEAAWQRAQELDFSGSRSTYLMAAVVVLVLLGSFWLGRRGVNSRTLDYLFTSAKPMMTPSAGSEPAEDREPPAADSGTPGEHASSSDHAGPATQPVASDHTSAGDHTGSSDNQATAPQQAASPSGSAATPATAVANTSQPDSSPADRPSDTTDQPSPLQSNAPPNAAPPAAPGLDVHRTPPPDRSAVTEPTAQGRGAREAPQPTRSGRLRSVTSGRRNRFRSTGGQRARTAAARPTPVSYRRFNDNLTGEISITTDPPGLAVLIDGKACGRSPVQRLVSAGAHKYRVLPPSGGAPGDGIFEVKPAALVRISLKWPMKIADSALSGGTTAAQGAFSQH